MHNATAYERVGTTPRLDAATVDVVRDAHRAFSGDCRVECQEPLLDGDDLSREGTWTRLPQPGLGRVSPRTTTRRQHSTEAEDQRLGSAECRSPCVTAVFHPIYLSLEKRSDEGQQMGEKLAAVASYVLALTLSLALPRGSGADELRDLPVCSAVTVTDGTAPAGVCTATSDSDGHNIVRINLTAQTGPIEVGGYTVTTDNYNANYLTPVVEAAPGDTVEAHIVNTLDPIQCACPVPPPHDSSPTNLHYFHGGIVSPNNARPQKAELGDGDNVYVYLRSDKDPLLGASSNSFDLKVPIPGDGELDARVLEGTGYIAHPRGLNWYHSHLHGISSRQVMGGMSGLLSAGDALANVRAATNVPEDTAELQRRTKVRYVLLRDMLLKGIDKRPDQAGKGSAEWDPMSSGFPEGSVCGAWNGSKLNNDNHKLRLGFCQRDLTSAWLFTLNGQRFPTITVEENQNLLIRMGNVSSNIGYVLEMSSEADGSVLPLTVLSVDGVVPGRPLLPDQGDTPIEAADVEQLLLMPASRVEFYVRNDQTPHSNELVYTLRTKGLKGIGDDEWPEIQLARIVLKPNGAVSALSTALNTNVLQPVPFMTSVGRVFAQAADVLLPEEEPPPGCMRDLLPGEYRRVTFLNAAHPSPGDGSDWEVATEIVHPSAPSKPEFDHEPVGGATIGPLPFEAYDLGNGTIDWSKPHVCVRIDRRTQANHAQLWVLVNGTSTLHNFHIHQIKFRLATRKELQELYHINPSETPCEPLTQAETPNIPGPPLSDCFDDSPTESHTSGRAPMLWHDTIPMPPGSWVYVIMSFDAWEQIGRFVFHCHILKHEDRGLMAPIEVWGSP